MKGYIEIEKYEDLQAKFDLLKFQMEQLQRMVFGAKSERYIPVDTPEQLSLLSSIRIVSFVAWVVVGILLSWKVPYLPYALRHCTAGRW